MKVLIPFPTVQNYRFLWTGLGAQLARDVPFSAICWAALEPVRNFLSSCLRKAHLSYDNALALVCLRILNVFPVYLVLQSRRKILSLVGEDANVSSVLGANFSAGFIAGSLAAAATCPLDVAKTRRQIEVSFSIILLILGFRSHTFCRRFAFVLH